MLKGWEKKNEWRPSQVYEKLFSHWGSQDWWPGDTPYEIAVGAILTQNTAWSNVERAIGNLKQADLLEPERMSALGKEKLAELIRPAGYFNVKAQRLQNFNSKLMEEFAGKMQSLLKKEKTALRKELLAINGIGPETADSIILYAAGKPVFVVDAYTRRFLERHGWLDGGESYEEVAKLFTTNLPADAEVFNEYHALIVKLGKEHCRKRPFCDACPLSIYPRKETV